MAPLVYSLYAFGLASRCPFLIYTFCVFAYQKKNVVSIWNTLILLSWSGVKIVPQIAFQGKKLTFIGTYRFHPILAGTTHFLSELMNYRKIWLRTCLSWIPSLLIVIVCSLWKNTSSRFNSQLWNCLWKRELPQPPSITYSHIYAIQESLSMARENNTGKDSSKELFPDHLSFQNFILVLLPTTSCVLLLKSFLPFLIALHISTPMYS